jgi:hypothetical protein
MESAERARLEARRDRWLAADYARLIGLRTVPGGLFLLGFAVIGPRVGHVLPVFLQAVLTYAAFFVAVLATVALEVWYREAYGSVSALPLPRRYVWPFVAILGTAMAWLLLRGSSPFGPNGFLGAALIFWSLPFEDGGVRRVRWHWVAAGLAVTAVGALDIHVAIPLLALLVVVFGVIDHLIFIRTFPKASAEPAGV